ncbi:MAG: hypothetical protein PHT94_00700 [Candidatus Nanoarchaeia archaeon]|nr:hypothetical protein [Candidatus Nanoarchaeia archaeon]
MEMRREDKAMYYLIQKMSINMMEMKEKTEKDKSDNNRQWENILDIKDEEIKTLNNRVKFLESEIMKLMTTCTERYEKIKELEKFIQIKKEKN